MIRAQVTKIQKSYSKHGDIFYYMFFKDLDIQKSYKTCLYSPMRNFKRWEPVIKAFEDKQMVILSNLILKDGDRLIDADSDFVFEGSHVPNVKSKMPAIPGQQGFDFSEEKSDYDRGREVIKSALAGVA